MPTPSCRRMEARMGSACRSRYRGWRIMCSRWGGKGRGVRGNIQIDTLVVSSGHGDPMTISGSARARQARDLVKSRDARDSAGSVYPYNSNLRTSTHPYLPTPTYPYNSNLRTTTHPCLPTHVYPSIPTHPYLRIPTHPCLRIPTHPCPC